MSSFVVNINSDNPIVNVPGRSQTICRYYVRGICRFGDLCRFSHDLARGRPEGEQRATNTNTDADVAPEAEPEAEAEAEVLPSTSRRNWANAPISLNKKRK